MKKIFAFSLVIFCLIFNNFVVASNSIDSEFHVVLKDGSKRLVRPNPNNNEKVRIFVGDKDGNLLIEKIILNNGSEVMVTPNENGVFLLKINEFEIEVSKD